MARARGVDTIVDAAQTIGHMSFTLADLDADFVGFSLHKWLCAPDYGAAQQMSRLLLEKHRILTVARRGITNGSAVRVTPTLYNTHAELDRLVSALRTESGAFR